MTSYSRHIADGCVCPMPLYDSATIDYSMDTTSYPGSVEQFVPHYVQMDKKVLKFDAYFEEPVYYSDAEIHHVRNVNVYYHLIDDTITVYEPHVDDSGLVQGRVFARQRVPKHNQQGQIYHWRDLNISQDVNFYGRVYRIVGCDEWTKKFLQDNGTLLNEVETVPIDPYISSRKQLTDRRQPVTDAPAGNSYWENLIKHGNSALKFYAKWDDLSSRITRDFAVTVHLIDGSVSVIENTINFAGVSKVFLRRQKLPSPKGGHYKISDFQLNKTIYVYGRPFKFYDCDDFTNDHIGGTVAIEKEESIDLMHSYLSVLKGDNEPDRNFVIDFWPEWNEIEITECLDYGKYYKRGRVFLPKQIVSKAENYDKDYRTDDFEVGKTVTICKWHFKIKGTV